MSSGTVVLTGARGGMAAIMAQRYHAKHPAHHLVLLVRDASKVEPGILPDQSATVRYQSLDMAKLQDVKAVAQSIAADVKSGKLPPIIAIVCSAAVQVTAADQPHVTGDGYEETVAVNHLAHSSLILELLPSMKPDGRIVIVGSDVHKPDYKFFKLKAKYEKLDTLLKVEPGSEPSGQAYDLGLQRYGVSKLLQMMAGQELARRLRQNPKFSGLRVVMLNPGVMGGTGLFRQQGRLTAGAMSFALRFTRLMNWIDPEYNTALKEDSAETLCKLAEDPSYADATPMDPDTGGAPYYLHTGDLMTMCGAVNDPVACKELWEDTARVLSYSGEKALE